MATGHTEKWSIAAAGDTVPKAGKWGRTLGQPAASTGVEGFSIAFNPEGQSITRQMALDPECV